MNYATLASDETIVKTTQALTTNNFQQLVVTTKEEALEKIKELIPAGASVMNGTSRTLEQIGYIDYLKSGSHGWNNLHEPIVKETDPVKQGSLRKQALLSDYYVGSLHALSETGELVIASNTGSQLPHLAYSSPNIILVASTKKITPTLIDAINRLEQHVVPLEDERMMGLYGAHTTLSKMLVYHKEAATSKRKITIILVKEDLGF